MTSRPSPRDDEVDEQITATEGVLLPGGKVDPDAIRRLVEDAGKGEDDAELRRVTFRLRRDLNKRLDRYLTDRVTFMSRNQLQRLIDEGGVLVNARLPKASTMLRKGDVVEVVIPPPPATEIQPEEIPLEVLFEDDHLIVLNKPAGIIVHPARSHLKGTMVNALAWHFRHRSGVGGALSTVGGEFARPGVVHRLDRHTSGVIVFARRDEAHWKLGHQFQARGVDKRYLAVVEGRVEPAVQVIELPIGPSRSREKGYREKYCVRHDDQGRDAVTICRVRERYTLGLPTGRTARVNKGQGPADSGRRTQAEGSPWRDPGLATQHAARSTQHGAYSLVELELKTGRTHQIRVHLSYLGWPIVGDDMYGGKPFADASGKPIIERQALHAAILGFTHPITNQRLVFTAPLRGDISALVRDLRSRSGVESVDAPGATVDLRAAVGA